MRYVPAGSFQRDGNSANISKISAGYWMGETEVTQGLFEAVMGSGVKPSNFTVNPEDSSGDGWKKLPVEHVTWYDAVEFCNKLSTAVGKTAAYTITGRTPSTGYPIISATVALVSGANGYRLPTEMEWMWAAMGATGANNGYLKGYAGSSEGSAVTNIGDYAWYYGNVGSKTHQVGYKTANELGLKDMSGNVFEWCWDWYGTYPTGEQTDYKGVNSGSSRVVRGGSWGSSASSCALSVRFDGSPDVRGDNLGFRVVCP
jgi:formylglycine-generating enzyme required for sulfatase activity